MPSENIPAQIPNAAPAGEPAAPQVTDALLQDLNANPGKMKELDPVTRKAVMHRLTQDPSAQADDAAAAPPDPAPDPADKPKEDPPPAETPQDLPQPFDKKAARKKHQEEADEANLWEQKLKAAKARKERAKAEFEEIEKKPIAPPDDPWDKDHQTTVFKELTQTKEKLKKLEEHIFGKEQDEFESVERIAQQKRDDAEFGQIHALQEEYPELRTEKPFRQLNDAYSAWHAEMVEKSGVKAEMPSATPAELHQAAAARYEKDPEFQKTVGPIPIPEKDREKFNTALTLFHRKAAQGGSFKANWLEMLDDTGVLEEVVQRGRKQGAAEGAARTVQAIKKQEDAVTPISPADGSIKGGYQDDQWDLKKAGEIQRALIAKQRAGTRLTDQDRANLRTANAAIQGHYAREAA